MNGTLFYIHDPMCSWCWGFKPALESLLKQLPETVRVQRVLGGLAPDSNDPMPKDMQYKLAQIWHQIQTTIPGTEFNFDFWSKNQPKRSTWPACRAVLAAVHQNPNFEVPMITAIQEAYYLHAANPSETATLVSLACSIGCDQKPFEHYLHSDDAHKALASHLALTQQLQVQGFPSLAFVNQLNEAYVIRVDFIVPENMLQQIESVAKSEL